jgi:hypothetical protein
MTSIGKEYLTMLREWAEAMRPYLFTPADRPDLTYYGDGTNGWGTQTNQKALAALAALATLPGGEPKWIPTALAMLRYSLESHLVGSYHLSDGEDMKWGHTWISPLGVERMMFGVDLLLPYMTEDDRALLRRMLISEADWHLTDWPVRAGLVDWNFPESNMWNGALLLRTASLYPDCPNAAAYVDRGTDFLVNAVSVPSTSQEKTVYEGKTAAERFVGANFFESYATDHHHYMNVGYMVITLSNASMLYFHYRTRGLPVPPVLLHNLERLWQLVKSFLYEDGRLLRIGGDTRIRYCYCQDYLLQTLNMAADLWGEETDGWERGWIGQLMKERTYNGDGSFLSRRAEIFVERSPLYYTRLESDRASCIAFSAVHRHLFSDFAEPAGRREIPPLTVWSDAYHGSYLVREPGRYAAFTWRGAEGPSALCLPPEDSSLAEWKLNLTGAVTGNGSEENANMLSFGGRSFIGGFLTWGSYVSHTRGLLEEQIREEDTVRTQLVCAALPDGKTMIVMQYARAVKNCHITSASPLHLNIPNDVFNGFSRTYTESEGRVTVDGRMTVIPAYGGRLKILRPPYRQIGIRASQWVYPTRGFLHADEISMDPIETPVFLAAGQIAFDIGAAVTLSRGGFAAGSAIRAVRDGTHPLLRGVTYTADDGTAYTVLANFGETDAEAVIGGRAVTVPAGAGEIFW